MRRITTAGIAAVAALLLAGKANAFNVSGGGEIVDGAGHPIQLNAVAWFGMDQWGYAPHGLWQRNWRDMIAQMKSNGVNAVRIALCPATIHGATVTVVNYSDNPDLQGLNSLQLLDKLVAAFDANGIYVLLDHHVADANGASPLWYTNLYSEQNWISDLTFLANRYKNNPHVLGWDLKNEPHNPATWGSGNNATDWNRAAERASAAVLAVAPNWLVFVEGIQDNPDDHCQTDPSIIQHFWGENLEPFRCAPLNIPKNKLVLAPHVYGPSVYHQANLYASNFPNNMPGIYDQLFGWLHDQGYAVVPTEFGGEYKEGDGVEDKFEENFITYMAGKGMTSLFYWAFNGDGWPRGGLLETDWTTINPNKLALMHRLWAAGAQRLQGSAPVVSLAANPSNIRLGGSATLNWTATNATRCTTAGTGWAAGTAKAVSGAVMLTPAQVGTYAPALDCTGPGGTGTASAKLTVASASASAPTVTVSLSPATVVPNQHATATWSSTKATSCSSGGNGWPAGQGLGLSGSGLTYSFSVLGAAYTVTVACTGPGGSQSASAILKIAGAAIPAPAVSLTVSPATVTPYQHATVSWSSSNATSCVSGGTGWPSGTVLSLSGSSMTYSFAQGGNSYSLAVACRGNGGSTTRWAFFAVSR